MSKVEQAAHKIMNSKDVAQFKSDLHLACIEWATEHESEFPFLEMLFHPGYGKIKTFAKGDKLNLLGVHRGIPRFIIPIPNAERGHRRINGMVIEIKHPDIGLSIDQDKWLKRFKRHNYSCVTIESLDDFKDAIMKFNGDHHHSEEVQVQAA